MRPAEFDEQMKRLKAKFDPQGKTYDDQTKLLFGKALLRLSDGVFTQAVDLALVELRSTQAPMLPELLEFVRRARETMPKQANQVRHAKCAECGTDVGYVLLRNPDTNHQVPGACGMCEPGRVLQAKGYRTVFECKRAGFTHHVYPPDDQIQTFSKTPWPASLEAMLTRIARGQTGGMAFALKLNRMSRDEADYLIDVARRKAWDEPWAKEIIAKVPKPHEAGRAVVRQIGVRA